MFDRLVKKWLRLFSTGRMRYRFAVSDWVRLRDLDALSSALESKRFSRNLSPLEGQLTPGNILVLAPHPDDEILGAGGALLLAKRAGSRIKVIYLTNGTREQSGNKSEPEKEAVKAAALLGYETEFWGYPVRSIPLNNEILDRLRACVAAFAPVAVLVPFIADDHDDHRRASQLFFEAFNSRPADFEVWAYQVYSTLIPNVVCDITPVIEEKLRLVALWDSQKRSRDWGHYIRGLNALNSRFLRAHEPRYAETFFCLPGKEYVSLCSRYFSKGSAFYGEGYRKHFFDRRR